MAEGTIELQIVTPDGVALREEVQSLTAPSVDGEFGVLPGHRPLLAALKTGIMGYVKDGQEVRLAVGAGFVEINNDRAVLITDQVARKDDIDPVRVRLDLKEADEALERFTGEPGSAEHVELIRKELWAAAQLTLYGDPPPPTIHTLSESLAGGSEIVQHTEGAEGAESTDNTHG